MPGRSRARPDAAQHLRLVVALQDRDQAAGGLSLGAERGETRTSPSESGPRSTTSPVTTSAVVGDAVHRSPPSLRPAGAEQAVDRAQLPVQVAGSPDRELVRDPDRRGHRGQPWPSEATTGRPDRPSRSGRPTAARTHWSGLPFAVEANRSPTMPPRPPVQSTTAVNGTRTSRNTSDRDEEAGDRKRPRAAHRRRTAGRAEPVHAARDRRDDAPDGDEDRRRDAAVESAREQGPETRRQGRRRSDRDRDRGEQEVAHEEADSPGPRRIS